MSWRIWIDGETLFHSIETLNGKAKTVVQMAARGPVEAGWDELIATLVDEAPSSAADLDLVWHWDRRQSPRMQKSPRSLARDSEG